MFRKLSAAIALAVCTTTAFAEVVTIEGFEDTSDPGDWQVSLTTATHNLLLDDHQMPPEYVSTNVTEGIRAGRFHSFWSETSSTATENPYEPGGTLLYWSVRYNVVAPSSLPNNVINTVDGVLEADIANESPYPVQVALVVDTETFSQLERGPLVTIDANSTHTYSWNFATQSPVGFDGGDGVISGNARLKTLLVYTTNQPTTNELDITVDNIRTVSTVDMVAPAIPRLMALEQGPAPGQAILRWRPVTDSDLASYNIYISNDSQFNTPVINRLTFPETPARTVAGSEQSVTLTSLPIGQNVYVAITAVDNAPQPNESGKSQVVAINLAADGTAPTDRLVLDHDEFSPDQAQFVTNGYFHAAVYTAQALDALGRTFDTVTADAVLNNDVSLAPSATGIVIWSNLLDGTNKSNGSIHVNNLPKIQALVSEGGNVIVSGSAVAEDVQASHGNLETYLRATFVSGNVNLSTINTVGPLTGVPQISTSLNPSTHIVAFATTANDGILPANGSVDIAHYDGIPTSARAPNAVAGVAYGGSLVFLVFAFESAGNLAQPADSPALRQQLMDVMVQYLLGETAVNDWHLFD